MLSNPSQYFPQGLLSQFSGLQAAGLPQVSPGLFGQPGAYNGYAQFGNAQFGHPQFGPESGQTGLGPQLPFGQAQPLPFGLSQPGPFGGQIPAHQIVPVLGQLAQQLAAQSAVAQQIGIAVHQLAHQLALQGQQGYAGAYGGFNPQAQAWGAQRPQTIQ
jgi:hypothetical protein